MISAGIIVDISLLFYRFQWSRLFFYSLYIFVALWSLAHIDVQASAYSSFKHSIEMRHYKIECIIDVIHSRARPARVNVYSPKYIYILFYCAGISMAWVCECMRARDAFEGAALHFSFSLFEHSNPMQIIHLYYYNYIQ